MTETLLDWLHDPAVTPWLEAFQWVFILYFIGLSAGYLMLNLSALRVVNHHLRASRSDLVPSVWQSAMPPVSVLVPAYNEATTIVSSVHSLLQLTYPEFEIIVINDGSSDETLDVLREAFDLQPVPPSYRRELHSAPIRQIYQSARHPGLQVVDKDNGGKADALNAGINLCQYPLFCGVDADSILQRDSLLRIMRPFLEDPDAIAAGGTIRVANGCSVRDGLLVKAGLPRGLLPRLQILEYLRAFLFGRLGWAPFNALLIISGAFGVFRKSAVIEVGGYRHNTIGEDMELVVRLHRHMRLNRKRYRIHFIPDPVCWTEAPEKLSVLRSQRIRWQRGLLESLAANRQLLFHRRGGAVSWVAYPFVLFFEALGPFLEISAYVFTLVMLITGALDVSALWLFLLAAIGFGMLVSVIALLLEELSFPVYPGRSSLFRLFWIAIVENLGYRQLNGWWRLQGTWMWLTRRKSQWGNMKRSGNWQQPDSSD